MSTRPQPVDPRREPQADALRSTSVAFGLGNAQRRSLIAGAILAPWLVLIALFQVPLFAGSGGGPPGDELLPAPITVALIGAGLILRLARPSVMIHVVGLTVVICGVALLAANLGTPFANATADYCGDFCRTEIGLRFAAFFGWPVLAAAGLRLATWADRRVPGPEAAERAAWSRAWIHPTLILGLLASVWWWRAILP